MKYFCNCLFRGLYENILVPIPAAPLTLHLGMGYRMREKGQKRCHPLPLFCPFSLAYQQIIKRRLNEEKDYTGALDIALNLPRDVKDQALFDISREILGEEIPELKLCEAAADKISTYHYPLRNQAYAILKDKYEQRGNATDALLIDAKINHPYLPYYIEALKRRFW